MLVQVDINSSTARQYMDDLVGLYRGLGWEIYIHYIHETGSVQCYDMHGLLAGQALLVQAQACCLHRSRPQVRLLKWSYGSFDCIPQRQSSNRAGAVAGKSRRWRSWMQRLIGYNTAVELQSRAIQRTSVWRACHRRDMPPAAPLRDHPQIIIIVFLFPNFY